MSEYVPVVRALIGRFFLEHGPALSVACGGFDELAVVPSTTRLPPHPLEAVVDSLSMEISSCSRLTRGDGELSFRKPSATGYAATAHDIGRRVLIIDDVYTTGARINSAAIALENAGHEVAGALVIARRINPDYNDLAAALWHGQAGTTFDWSVSPVIAGNS